MFKKWCDRRQQAYTAYTSRPTLLYCKELVQHLTLICDPDIGAGVLKSVSLPLVIMQKQIKFR